MRRTGLFLTIVSAFLLTAQAALAEVGPVRLSVMNRVESHSKISDVNGGDYSPETFNYFMISASRMIQQNVLGSVYYLNKYSYDENDVAANIGGVSVSTILGEHAVFSLGYSHSSNPERGVIIITPHKDNDRFSGTFIYNFKDRDEGGPRYSSVTSFSTVTDLGEQQTLSEKLKVDFPIGKKWEGGVAYTFSYSYDIDDQLTNQGHGTLQQGDQAGARCPVHRQRVRGQPGRRHRGQGNHIPHCILIEFNR